MQLVLSNAQSELSPLEIGIHALEAVGPFRGRFLPHFASRNKQE
jgi:hypothetical protein